MPSLGIASELLFLGLGTAPASVFVIKILGLPGIRSALQSQQASPGHALRWKAEGSGKNTQDKMVEIKEGHSGEREKTPFSLTLSR